MATSPSSLYDRVGGKAGIASLMNDFYLRILADNELRGFFEGLSLDKLERMQTEFFSAVLDGPVTYSGRALIEIHADLGIKTTHLQRFFEHLVDTMRGMGIDDQDIYEIASRLNAYSDEITGQPAGLGG